jgi:competence protein ComEA
MVMMKFAVCALLGSFVAAAQPPAVRSGPGRAEMGKMCTGCHELARSVAPRQDRDGWIQTMTKMSAYGMKSTDKEFATVLNYLSTNYPAPPIPPLNINTARAIELEARLSLLRSQAARLIAWREKNGPFESLSDLKKVPNIDFEKIESHKSSIVF